MISTKITGVLVSVHAVGVLIRGPAASGKSLTALNLMRRGHKLVSDDLVDIVLEEGRLVGRPMEEHVRIEIRGVGVYEAATLFPDGTVPFAAIDFGVDLDRYDPSRDAGRITPETGQFVLLETSIPTVRVPLPDRVDPALVVELLSWRFRQMGAVTSE